MKDIEIIPDIKKALNKEPRILAAYIFGSYAKENHTKESDFDTADLRNFENQILEYLERKIKLDHGRRVDAD